MLGVVFLFIFNHFLKNRCPDEVQPHQQPCPLSGEKYFCVGKRILSTYLCYITCKTNLTPCV